MVLGLQHLNQKYRIALRPICWMLLVLAVIQLISCLAPSLYPYQVIANYAPLHTLLEFFSIVIALLVFTVIWSTFDKERPGNFMLLACIFAGVALLDLLHTLSYQGMPDFITPNGPEKAIDFWLEARSFSAFGLLTFAFLPWRWKSSETTRWLALTGVLSLVGVLSWIEFLHPEWTPRTYIPGQGMTKFKVMYEYFLIALFVIIAFRLLLQMRAPQPYNVVSLFAGVCTMALSELFFTLYANVTDVFNLLGHVYKAIAYGFIYNSVFIDSIRVPYQRMQEAKNLLQAVIEAIPMRVFWKDRESRYLGCNTLFAIDAGEAGPENVIGKFDLQLAWREQAELYRFDDRQVMDSLSSKLSYEEPMMSGSGKLIWLRTSKAPLYNAVDDVVGVLGIFEDITQQKQDQQKLREQDTFYRSVIEASGDSFWLVDTEGRLLQVSDNYVARSGYSQEELLTKHLRDLVVMDEAEIVERIEKTILEKHALFETEMRRKDGVIWPVEVSAVFVPIAGGRFFSFIRDISERKQVENRLRISENSLKEAQKLAQMGNWELDILNNKLHWSEEIFRIFEIDSSQFAATYESFMVTVHPEDRDAVNNAYLSSVRNRSEYSIVHRLLMADGRIKYVHERAQTFYQGHQPIRSIGTVQDVTQARLAEEELRLYRHQLESLVRERTIELEAVNQELEAFAYSVSHDLRSPLRSINGFSQALIEDYQDKLGETGVVYLKRVIAASQRMGELIDDLLKLSRITRKSLNRQQVDLSGLAQTLLQHLQEASPKHQVETCVQPGLNGHGDPGLLKIMLGNLLGNAWKYSAKQASPHIEFGSIQQNTEIVYYVSDNGVGFDMKYADKLFGAFQRLHSRDQFEGNGIGLATVKRVIQRHGGSVWADSEPGRKTTFYFTLPSHELESEDSAVSTDNRI